MHSEPAHAASHVINLATCTAIQQTAYDASAHLAWHQVERATYILVRSVTTPAMEEALLASLRKAAGLPGGPGPDDLTALRAIALRATGLKAALQATSLSKPGADPCP